ncbi:hypothetical protein [Pseudochelatococcus sp. G4_1912]|uniref:hypothetical protein n=1 Tax=Pseudochelatococcus sp. G4_1912 TaxID=3114288 RepID=UPI0039C5D134
MANHAQQAPWSVKGIAPQTREAVKDAARRSGMTIGEWLNVAITQQAESDLSSRQDSPTPHDLRWAEIAAHLAKHVRPENSRTALSDPAIVSTHAIEQLLRDAQARQEQQAREQSMRLAEALTGLARYIEHAENRQLEEIHRASIAQQQASTDLAQTLTLVAQRIKRLERQLTHLPQDLAGSLKEVTTQHVNEMSTQLLPAMEQRLAAQMRDILNSLNVVHASSPTHQEAPADAEQLKVEDRLARAIVDIRSKQVELARLESGVAEDLPQKAILERLEGLSRQLDTAFSPISEKSENANLAALLTRLDRIDLRLDDSQPSLNLVRLEDMVHSLSENIEALHASSRKQSTSGPAALDTLAQQISQLAQRLDDVTRQTLHASNADESDTRERFTALERAVNNLSLQLRDLPLADTASLERMAQIAANEALAALSADDNATPRELSVRAEDALDAVHNTLERVVDRLAQLENDIRNRRIDTAPARTFFTGEPELRAAKALAQAGLQSNDITSEALASDGPEDLLARKTVGLTENVGATTGFIAAARRAAMAAADETRLTTAQLYPHSYNANAIPESNAEAIIERRRSLLIGLGALIAATGAAQIATVIMDGATRLS